MKRFSGWFGGWLAMTFAPTALSAVVMVIDDFSGSPQVVSLVSTAPPEIQTGTFLHSGAVGGVRDVAVVSAGVGSFVSGVAFGDGIYTSSVGAGMGFLFWDGDSGVVDADGDGFITTSDFAYGLGGLNLTAPAARIEFNAFADLSGAAVAISLLTSATDYAVYLVDLTTVGEFAAYSAELASPTFAIGSPDLSNVNAISMMLDGEGRRDVDIRVNGLQVTAVPEPEEWLALGGAGCIVAAVLFGRRRAGRAG